MASLNHVSIRDKEYGWVHITPEDASRLFPNTTVSSNDSVFICELCGQYVTFTGSGFNTRHFRHSRGEESKDCDERVEQYNHYPTIQYGRFDFPLKLSLDRGTFSLSIGIPQGAFQGNDFSVSIKGTASHFFNMKERKQEAGITWLPLQQDISIQYHIETRNKVLLNWPDYIPGINPMGTMFDSRGNKVLHSEDEVTVGNDYYLITNRYICEYFRDVTITELMHRSIMNSVWRIYKVRAVSFSPDSARFFILYKLHLVKKPTDLHIIWPMTVEEGSTAYHNADNLYIAHNGEGQISLQLMPYSAQSTQKEMGGYFQVQSNGFQQMVAFKWHNGQRNCSNHLMVWKKPFTRTANIPAVAIFDKNEELLQEEIYNELPPRNQITIFARYDGILTLKVKDKIKLVHQIKGGERFSLDVAMGNSIVITQGCDIIRRISFQKKDAEFNDFTLQLSKALKRPANEYIHVPHRFGQCIDKLPPNSGIKESLASYIRQGKIPKNIYVMIIKQLRFGK